MSPAHAARGLPRLRAPALVLRRFPYGESSLIVHALTPEHGRLALLAKGAYRPSSGFFAVFDFFDTLDLRWGSHRGQELGLVTAASLRTRRSGLALDLERYRTALGLLELAHLTAREGHEEHALFAWLEGGLDLLARGRAAPALVAAYADLGLLRLNGLEPALEACASCGLAPATSAGEAAFSAALGGRLCPSCAAAARGRNRPVESLPLNVMRVAASLMEATPAMLEHTTIEAKLLERVRAFVERFLEYHLEARLRTRRQPIPHPPRR